MALATPRSLAQLKAQCQKLGIQAKMRGKKEAKDDYTYALRDYFIQENYGGPANLPLSLKLMLQIESPMLSEQYKKLKPEVQKELWTSNKWYFEEKEDGNRQVHFIGLPGENYQTYSRNLSVSDFLPVAYGEKIYTDDIDFTKIKDQFVIDSEVICTNPNISTIMGSKGVVTATQLQAVTAILSMNAEDSIRIQKEEDCPLHIKAFDCLWFNGEWLINKPLLERRKYLKIALEQMQAAGFKVSLPKSNMSNKKAFYESIIKEGGEGCIAKKITDKYYATTTRSHRSWVKIKRTMSESLGQEGLGDTVDAFISGYEVADMDKSWAGLVGALELSVYLIDEQGNKTQHMIAKVANIDMETRKAMTIKDPQGNPILDPSWYGKVVECDGQAVSARARRLKHAILVRFRPDKCADQCTMEESFLNSMIL